MDVGVGDVEVKTLLVTTAVWITGVGMLLSTTCVEIGSSACSVHRRDEWTYSKSHVDTVIHIYEVIY